MRVILLPIDLDAENAINFSKELSEIDLKDSEPVQIDITQFCKQNGRVEPFGALIVINSYKLLRKKCKDAGIKFTIKYTKEEYIKNKYAKSLRFYGSLGLEIGESPQSDYWVNDSSSFIPIMKKDLRQIYKAPHEQDELTTISKDIAAVLSKKNQNLFSYIEYCINEILRNVIEHSGKREIWYCAQYWPSKFGGEKVEIALMDTGIGIKKSLEEELGEDVEQVLQFALVPGCSSKPTTHYIDSAVNSGFGLYMISEIGKENGKFHLASNGDALKISEQKVNILPCYSEGTIVAITLEIQKLEEYKVRLEHLVTKGLEQTEKYKKYRERKKFAPGLSSNSFF